jgi:hypothetical protein
VSALDLLTVIGPPVMTVVETFPMWGPVAALVGGALFWQAVCLTWQGRRGDTGDTRGHAVLTVLPDVPAVGDKPGATPGVSCGDSVPAVSPERETGGA